MTDWLRRRRAAVLLLVSGAAGAAALAAVARAGSLEVPAYRAIGASEAMTAPGVSGTDYSANPPSLAGLALLATIPAPAAPRRGHLIQAQCAAGLAVAFDDAGGAGPPTIVFIAGAASDGGQGGSLDMSGMPHTGRIRVYSSNASCQMAARSW